jgi:hypothetical protein
VTNQASVPLKPQNRVSKKMLPMSLPRVAMRHSLANVAAHTNTMRMSQAITTPLYLSKREYNFDSVSGRGSGNNVRAGWPRTMVNTGLCVCPQGERMVVERFGKMVDIKSPGCVYIRVFLYFLCRVSVSSRRICSFVYDFLYISATSLFFFFLFSI